MRHFGKDVNITVLSQVYRSPRPILIPLYAILDKSGKLLQNGSVGANALTKLDKPYQPNAMRLVPEVSRMFNSILKWGGVRTL